MKLILKKTTGETVEYDVLDKFEISIDVDKYVNDGVVESRPSTAIDYNLVKSINQAKVIITVFASNSCIVLDEETREKFTVERESCVEQLNEMTLKHTRHNHIINKSTIDGEIDVIKFADGRIHIEQGEGRTRDIIEVSTANISQLITNLIKARG